MTLREVIEDQVEELDLSSEPAEIVEPAEVVDQADEATTELALLEDLEASIDITPSAAMARFGYSGISQNMIADCEAAVDRIRCNLRSVIDLGRDLQSVKDKLGHGQFLDWLKHYFQLNERTAQNYMALSRAFGKTPQVIDHVPAATLYKLSAKSTPAEVRRSVVDDVDAGKQIDSAQVEQRIIEAREVERRKKVEDREEKVAQRARKANEEWQRREQKMKNDGKSDNEIATARNEWDSRVAQRELAKAKAHVPQKKQDEDAKQQLEGEARRTDERSDHERLAATAVDMLKSRLGTDFEAFRDLVDRSNILAFGQALKAA